MNIEYPHTDTTVKLVNKKPSLSWMRNWTQEKRDAKFFEFCNDFDKRQDNLLFNDFQIFSHRLHWHEHPFVDIMRNVVSPKDRLFYTLVFSFSNEHWGTLKMLMDYGIDATREHFRDNRHARSDLFQIYYPKNTNVKEWLLTGPLKAAEDLQSTLTNSKQYTMMGYAKILEKYFKEHLNFRSPLYPCKNAARYLAMTYPHKVNPESILFGGTGFFDGMFQYTQKQFNGKCKYEIDVDGAFIPKNEMCLQWLNWMDYYAKHPDNPILEQKYLNIEDKLCFAYKHIAITHGVKNPTKRIPYNWIFPLDFELNKGGRTLNGQTTRHLWDSFMFTNTESLYNFI